MTVNWEQAIEWQAKQALAAIAVQQPGEVALLPFTGRLMFDLCFYSRRPASLPKHIEYPLNSRPGDIDNLAKSVLDALQNIRVIGNDSQVTDLNAAKRFADQQNPEGVDITMTAWLPRPRVSRLKN